MKLSIRTPIRPQFQTTECAVGVLRTMLSYFGKEVSAREIRRITGITRDCLNASDIRRAAAAFGLVASAYRGEPDTLARFALPVIVHLRFIHFVVLEEIGPTKVRLNCPAAGCIEMPRGKFDEDFTGFVLSLAPGPDLQAASVTEDTERALGGAVRFAGSCRYDASKQQLTAPGGCIISLRSRPTHHGQRSLAVGLFPACQSIAPIISSRLERRVPNLRLLMGTAASTTMLKRQSQIADRVQRMRFLQ